MSSHKFSRAARGAATATAALAAFFAFASFAIGAGVAIVSGPSVQPSEMTASSAVVRWQTDVESTTVVRFGTTTALGQEYKKIEPITEVETTEIVHTMTLAGLQPDTTYFYVAHSATADAAVDSPMLSFHTPAACQADTWECGAWGACSAATGTQTRICTMTNDCPDVSTPRPSQSQACTPACTADTWECSAWGACAKSADGSYDQPRTCTLKTDCPGVTTPKPAESQSCTPSCTADTWSCTAYGACDPATSKQARTCTLKTDCPTATTAKPAESRSCTVATPPPAPPAPPAPAPVPPPAPPPQPACDADVWDCGAWGDCVVGANGGYFRTRNCTLATDCPAAETPSPSASEACEPPANAGAEGTNSAPAEGGLLTSLGDAGIADTVTVRSEPGSTDPNQSLAPDYVVTLVGVDPALQQELVRECRDNGILASRCAAWLTAKYQDRRCLDAGKTTRETCEGYLTGLNGGIFPGCEGRTDTECAAVKGRPLMGYINLAAKAKFDAVLQGALDGGLPVETIDGLTAVTPATARTSIWWPSLEGDTAPAMIIGDMDRDGLPDDLEVRMGWDPRSSDVEGDAKQARAVLKSFFEHGDKPTQFVFVDVDGNGSLDLVEDRKLLGLKTYDPVKVYLPGDTSKRVKNMMAAFFGAEGDMAAKLGVDLDGDGVPEAKLSRAVLKTFFQKGDRPTEQQFGSMIDPRAFAPADLALITGHAIGQPLGAGETDPSFTVAVDLDANTTGKSSPSRDANEPSLGTPTRDQNEPGVLGIGPVNAPMECETDRNCPPEYPQCVDRRCIGDGHDANEPQRPGTTGYNDRGNEGDYSKHAFVLRGKAAPHAVVVLYIYSYVPMVLTTTTDENGQYTYDVSDSVVDGEHTAYVAVTDDTGKVAKKSSPLSFFVKEAQAVTQDDFYASDSSANVPTEPVAQWQRSYLIGAGAAVVLALIGVWLFVARKLGPDQPPTPPAEPPKQ
ncbi:MAG TPA: fibronectin type III domain-containing protein [Candidatus Binatia bacterium]|nr:fibronectin type III domain-containing protein [Candidatus Binatia bacterium]